MKTDPRAALDLDVPAVPQSGPAGSLDWLRASTARFSTGEDHRRRRAYAEELLRSVSSVRLRCGAARASERIVDAQSAPFDAIRSVARVVPVAVLGAAIGRAVEPRVIDTIARSLRPGAMPDARADAAVAEALAGREATEREAAAIGVLAQSCDATAGLIGNALLAGERKPERVASEAPPVRSTRRVDLAGQPVVVDLAALGAPFGAGAHACPGREHALALAGGVLATLLRRCTRTGEEVIFEEAPNLQMPARLLMVAK
jgi:cytochrome P450